MSVVKHSLLAKGDRPLSDKMMEFVASAATPFHNEKMRDFLQDQGFSQGGAHYYVYVNQEGFKMRHGFVSFFENEFFVAADETVWQISYDNPTKLSLLSERTPLPDEVALEFRDGEHEVRLLLSMPVVRDEHPSLDRYSNRNTKMLHGEFESRIGVSYQ